MSRRNKIDQDDPPSDEDTEGNLRRNKVESGEPAEETDDTEGNAKRPR